MVVKRRLNTIKKKSLNEELSRVAYIKWQENPNEKNKLGFLTSIIPFIATVSWIHIQHKCKTLSYKDQSDLADSMITEIWQRLTYIDLKKKYELALGYVGIIIERKIINIHNKTLAIKRTGTEVHIDKKHKDKEGDYDFLNLESQKDFLERQIEFFEILDNLCKSFNIGERQRRILVDKYYYGLTLEEIAKGYNKERGTSKQYIEATLARLFYRIRASSHLNGYAKELKELLGI